MCVCDYDPEVGSGSACQTIVQARGRYRRHQVHRLSQRVQSERLRPVVLLTNEPGWPARAYEVRVYDDPGQ